MQTQECILSYQVITSKPAQNASFGSLESTDNQCVYFCRFVSTFTGKEKDSETGFCYFGARYYDSDLSGIFLSVDPMSDKYPEISPYHYCHWNPLKKIDLDGNDEWEINQQGEIVKRIKTSEHDAFFIVDEKGNRMMDDKNMVMYKSISFDYGSVKELSTNYRLLDQTGFKINENSIGADLFKFFADNTSVEFGLVNTMESGAYLLTNHDNSKVGVTTFAVNLDRQGHTILAVSHNHPGGTAPSGFNPSDTHGDKFSAQRMEYSQGRAVNYFVYTKQDQQFKMYDGVNIYWSTDFSKFKNNYINVQKHK